MGRPRKVKTVDNVEYTVVFQEEIKPEKITYRTHTVKRGETIQSISSFYGVPTTKLISLNGTTTPVVGQILKID